MSLARVHVEAKNYNPNASGDERERNFKGLFTAFKKACSDNGIMRDFKRHECYEKPGEKRRRKRRESEIAMLKAKFRENFTEKRKQRDFNE